YVENLGGVQNVVRDEQEQLCRAGWSVIHLCPAQPLPMLASAEKPAEFLFSLRLNGEKHGYVRCGDLVRALARLRAKGVSLHWVVHHLMGHSPPAIRELAQACGSGETIFWIHDFFTCCPNYELMRNDIVFCGIPAPDSQACGICCYGEERHEHLRQIQQLFAELRPVVFAPSEP